MSDRVPAIVPEDATGQRFSDFDNYALTIARFGGYFVNKNNLTIYSG